MLFCKFTKLYFY